MELGITTFAEVTEAGVSPGERLRQVVEEAVLAEQVELFGTQVAPLVAERLAA